MSRQFNKFNWTNDPSIDTPLVRLDYHNFIKIPDEEKHNKIFIVDNCPISEPIHHDKLVPLICERCGGSIDKETYTCEHCGTQYEWR